MIKRNCEVCSKEIKISPSQIKSKKFCSRQCFFKKLSERMMGANNPSFKGGKVKDTNGYIRMLGSSGKRYEHQIVMEKYLGRNLKKGEEIHHINGIKTDNRLENLYLVDKKNHSRKHFNLFLDIQRLKWENLWLKKELKKYKK